MRTVRRRSYRSVRSKKRRKTFQPSLLHILLAITFGLLICSYLVDGIAKHFQSDTTSYKDSTLQQDTAYSLVGKPSIDAAFINQVLDHYHSPARGKGQSLYTAGEKYGIDPAYALAFFMQESRFGTKGVAKVTHSLGNIRATDGYPQYEGYRKYATWEEGFEDWYRLIARQYVNEWGLTTLDRVIPVYAPATDHNDERQYIGAVKYLVNTWRNGQIEAPV